jgi:hypothetical protein
MTYSNRPKNEFDVLHPVVVAITRTVLLLVPPKDVIFVKEMLYVEYKVTICMQNIFLNLRFMATVNKPVNLIMSNVIRYTEL